MKAVASEAFITGEGEWQTMAPGVKRRILGYDEAVMMVVVQFEPGSIGALHHHPHRQVSYVAKGSFEAEIDGVKKTLKTGDCFFVAPDLEHGVVALEAGTLIDVFAPYREDFLK